MFMIRFIVCIMYIIIFVMSHPPGNLTNLNICKLSHLGLEYVGFVSKSESFVRCQAWGAESPHRTSDKIMDEDFPEGSRKLAKNYCRNPNRDPLGPWCYTMNIELIDETCGLPLCSFSQCRLTGPGMEYGGQHRKSASDKKCLKWKKERKNIQHKGKMTPQIKFENIRFPDREISIAGKSCRNPDGDAGGPWCFVGSENGEYVEREYCDIPFCDELNCVVFTKDQNLYTHYTYFNTSAANITFGIKLWDSDSYLEASASLLLTLNALPLGGKDIQFLGIGIEITITNKMTALTVSNKDRIEYEHTLGILISSEYRFFSLSWHRGLITLNVIGIIKPIFLAEYRTKNNLMGFRMGEFRFYSALGTNVFWSFPFCAKDYECDVHVTTGDYHQHFWPLHESNVGRELVFHVRAFHSTKILLVANPATLFPNVLIIMKGYDNFTRITFTEYEGGPTLVLKEVSLLEVLKFWKWQEFSLSFFADTFQIYWTKSAEAHMIIELKHEIIKKLRWFSVSSVNTVAYWTFFCMPPDYVKPPPAWLPECAMNEEESGYQGTQDVTNEGLPCLPWSGRELIPTFERDRFKEETALQAFNYCRDPGRENKGTYCYVMTMLPEKAVKKTYCKLRKCKSEQCRMAGTGNDYTGIIAVTRSNRYCEPWFANRIHTVHPHSSQYLVDTLFPDLSQEHVLSYCRNPSRNPVGTWCYTIDPAVREEACLIKDCDKPEECIIIVSRNNRGRKTYILPKWKERGVHGGLQFGLKEWNPDFMDGLSIEITPQSGKSSLRLELGADYNQKINLFHNDQLVKHKNLPHLISAGTWTEFWLQIRQEEILLGYKGLPHALFEWQHPDADNAPDPMFISFSTLNEQYIGMSFNCDECHTQLTMVNNWYEVIPVGIWSKNESSNYSNFRLTLRGDGTVWLPLYNLIHTGDYLLLELNGVQNKVALYAYIDFDVSILSTVNIHDEPLFHRELWYRFVISFDETSLHVTKNGKPIFQFITHDKPLLVYFFALGVDNGWITWTVNCDPIDLDGPPRDGGWSPWSAFQCTVTCGGGEGFRTRSCNNPVPNVRGKLCTGSVMSTGKCNDFECGDLSPATLNAIHRNLQIDNYSFVVQEGSNITLPNNQEILKVIKKESPATYHEWTLNGLNVKADDTRLMIQRGDIKIRNVRPTDAGVYICVIFRISKKKLLIRVVSLAVISHSYNIVTRATRSVSLSCNAVVLGYVYSDLSLKWYLNKTIYKDMGIITLAAVNVETISHLKQIHTGDWKCVIEQKDLRLRWTTNIIRVLVRKSPNFYTNLMEDELTKPLFGRLKNEKDVVKVLFGIIASAVFISICLLIIYFKFCTFKRRKYKKNRRK